MSPKQAEIMKKYPLIFKSVDPRYAIMLFGIEHLDGWNDLTDNLCQQIDLYLRSEEGKYLQDSFYVSQVKSKYGTLRFYVENADDKIYALIDQTEQQSARICEECGSHGSLIKIRGWMWTLCERCEKNKR